MGGVIANNATGAHSILYGMTADHLLSADVVMADGSLATIGEESLELRQRAAAETSLFSNFLRAALQIRKDSGGGHQRALSVGPGATRLGIA